MNARAWIVTALGTVAALGGAGCSSGGSGEPSQAPQSKEGTGTITAALSAVGPDGATYILNNTELDITPTGDAGGAGALLFQSTTGTQSFSVAAGSYTGRLNEFVGMPDGAFGWTMLKQIDGGYTNVSAVLLDTQPYNFTVTAGGTTNIALHFEIASVGTITFAAGTVTTSLSVDAGTLPPGHAAIAGNLSFAKGPPPSGSTTLDSLLAVPSTGTGNIPYAVSVTLTSPFVFAADVACANVVATVTATAVPDAGAEDAYAAWIQEMNGSTGQMCIGDPVAQTGPYVGTLVGRTGPATTAAFQNVFGMASLQFSISIGQLTMPTFLNNGVLSLGALNSPVTLPIGYAYLNVYGPMGVSAQAFTSGQSSTLQMSP
jgi:hypothetical protein